MFHSPIIGFRCRALPIYRPNSSANVPRFRDRTEANEADPQSVQEPVGVCPPQLQQVPADEGIHGTLLTRLGIFRTKFVFMSSLQQIQESEHLKEYVTKIEALRKNINRIRAKQAEDEPEVKQVCSRHPIIRLVLLTGS